MAQGVLIRRREGGVDRYLGVPYAAPPVCALRWRAPELPTPWREPREALAFGPDSLQPPFPGWDGSRGAGMNEDCLYLNVWAPAEARDAPVLVVIHGGGFQLLSGAYDAFDGSRLAAEGVVVVTFNYRLGLLGFSGGSWWLRDQIAALAWVQANIAAFGGAADRVTIIGVSAGGVSVNALTISPAARGLFCQAISVSGAGGSLFTLADHPPQPALGDAPPVYASAFATGAGELPVVDGDLIPALPSQALRKGASNAARLVVVFSTGEGSLLDELDVPTDALAQALLAQTPAAERGPVTPDAQALYSHLVFRQPALALADAAADAGAPTYVADYDALPAAARGALRSAGHGAALYDILGNPNPSPAIAALAGDPQDDRHSAGFRRRVLNFVRGGPPDGADGPSWPLHAAGQPRALRIDRTGEPSIGPVLGLQDLAALRDLNRQDHTS
ncbi:MAG: hypothetical protein ABS78_01210 [Phenylobacterium sp. SCN 70-31]|nr:MAG: hypothetical protein ABS78_01210 [Phenylobacterium sp. SCN 70-31]